MLDIISKMGELQSYRLYQLLCLLSFEGFIVSTTMTDCCTTPLRYILHLHI